MVHSWQRRLSIRSRGLVRNSCIETESWQAKKRKKMQIFCSIKLVQFMLLIAIMSSDYYIPMCTQGETLRASWNSLRNQAGEWFRCTFVNGRRPKTRANEKMGGIGPVLRRRSKPTIAEFHFVQSLGAVSTEELVRISVI